MTKFGDRIYQNGGTPVGNGGDMRTGNEYFVHHTGNNGNKGKSIDNPFATLQRAVTVSYNAGDSGKGATIYLMEGHAETILSKVNINIVGLLVKGLGYGYNKPQLTCGAAIDMIETAAADIQFENIDSPISTASSTSRFNVLHKGFSLKNSRIFYGTSDLTALTLAASTATDVTVALNEFIVTTSGADHAISVEKAGCARLKVLDNKFDGGDSGIDFDIGAVWSAVSNTDMEVFGNTFHTDNGLIVTSAGTGVFDYNLFIMQSTAAITTSLPIDIGGLKGGANNVVNNASTTKGFVLPSTAAST